VLGSGRRIERGVAITCLAACLAACGEAGTTAPTGDGGSGPGDDIPAPAGDAPEVPAGPRTVTIEIRGIAYNVPGGGDFVTIGLGETVRWVNLDGTIHTATSTSVPPGGKGFSSGPMSQGADFTFTPRIVGTWKYSCQHYPDRMADARIRVVE
jgi:plastocyanin